jgi:HAD superfamily hydrolase (TIGR01459 family)
MTQAIEKFTPLIEKYDLFITDIYGVVHDGTEIYPEVFENIQAIKKAGKNIVFLSNAPRRAIRTANLLKDFGIDSKMYNYVFTSGEFIFEFFAGIQEKGEIKKYYYIGPEKDRGLLDGLEHKMVDDPKQADIAIATGLEPHETIKDIEDEIQKVSEAKLELFCANPDKFVYKQSGKSHYCAGLIADRYIELGGKVRYFGKPHKEIYQKIFADFKNIDQRKILCIGDSLETDIRGANKLGLDSLLITSGLHLKDLDTKIGTLPKMEVAEKLFKEYQNKPEYMLSLF